MPHRPVLEPTGRPHVSDPAYVPFLRNLPRFKLKAETLAADYREACRLHLDTTRDIIAERLFAADEQYRFLRVVRIQARKVPSRRRDLEPSDFTQQALQEIQQKLPSARGVYAESNWDGFCFQCCLDAADTLYGETNHKLSGPHAPLPFPVDEEGEPLPIPALSASMPSQLPALEAIVARVIASIPDVQLHLVAHDQFGPDPSYVSGKKRSKLDGKPPLLDQLNLPQTPTNRDRVHTLINRARTLLAAEIIRTVEMEDLNMDLAEVHAWMKRKYRT